MHPSERIRGATSDRLQGVHVALAVSGSIASVEAVKLARELIRHGAEVTAFMSDAATRILHPDALEFATGRPPVTRLTGKVEHLLARNGGADAVVVAPATANTVAKMASGIDDTVVTSLVQASVAGAEVPIVVAPAMHEGMLDHPATAAHLDTLRTWGIDVVPPMMAEGEAKLATNEAIVEHVIRATGPQRLRGKRILVINGSTVEPIDDMRVVTNKSTGRTGFAFATEAFRLGADVDLWFGHGHAPHPPHIGCTRFVTVDDLVALAPKAAGYDLVLVPAAISDFTVPPSKGKRPSSGDLRLDLVPTPKVLSPLRDHVDGRLVGFKAESGVGEAALVKKAKASMAQHRLDAVVANDLTEVAVADTVMRLVLPDDVSLHKGGKADAARSVLGALADAFWPRTSLP